jgi:hypothetical protein
MTGDNFILSRGLGRLIEPSQHDRLQPQKGGSMQVPLKFNVTYGISGSPVAEVVHLLDKDWSYVLVTQSGRTEYKLRWVCSKFGKQYKPQFFKKRPKTMRRCEACRVGLQNRIELKRQGKNIGWYPQYAQGFGRLVPRRRR